MNTLAIFESFIGGALLTYAGARVNRLIGLNSLGDPTLDAQGPGAYDTEPE